MSIKKLNQKGFTLIEMMVVVAVISCLMLLIIPNAATILNSTQKTSCEALDANIEALETTYTYTKDADLKLQLDSLKTQRTNSCGSAAE